MSVVTLGNRAYERISKVLGLFGGQTVNDIDIGTAFPVHSLDAVIQADQQGLWVYNVEETRVGAGTSVIDVNPDDPTDWDVVVTPGNEVLTTITDDDIPNQTDYDIWITHVGVANAGNVISSAILFLETAISTSATFDYPLGGFWDDPREADTGLYIMLSTAEPYYAAPMPYRMHRQQVPRIKLVFSGAGTAAVFMLVTAAPKGVVTFASRP